MGFGVPQGYVLGVGDIFYETLTNWSFRAFFRGIEIYSTLLLIPKTRNLPPLFLSSVFAKNSTLVKLKCDISIPSTLSGSIPKMYASIPFIVPECAIITAVCGSKNCNPSSQIETRSNCVKMLSPFGGENVRWYLLCHKHNAGSVWLLSTKQNKSVDKR